MVMQLRRWLSERQLVTIADSTFAAILWLSQLPRPICLIVPFWLEAALYEPAPTRRPGQRGRPRVKGKRLPTYSDALALVRRQIGWHGCFGWPLRTRKTLSIHRAACRASTENKAFHDAAFTPIREAVPKMSGGGDQTVQTASL
jgi:hypothetical protein